MKKAAMAPGSNSQQARRVFFITGTRAEYDLMSPVLKAISKKPGLTGELVLGAAHLSPFHGKGIDLICKDGFSIAGTVESLLCSETWRARGLSFCNLLQGLIYVMSANRPDVIFVSGDREEALAGALAGSFLKIPIAHLHGGDRCIVTELDEVIRPAVSKLAHIHFTATESHRERLIRMGERPEFIWATGGTGLDGIREAPDVNATELERAFGIDVSKPFFLLIYHPASLINETGSGEEMAQVLEGALALGHPVLCSYPNFDPGNMAIRSVIDRFRTTHRNLVVFHTLARSQFVALYRRCAAIVGNSSSIVIESAFVKVPGLLVGPRQDLRERGPNVLRLAPRSEEVRDACLRALQDEDFRRIVQTSPSLYGDGHAAPRIANVINDVQLSDDLLQKTMTY